MWGCREASVEAIGRDRERDNVEGEGRRIVWGCREE